MFVASILIQINQGLLFVDYFENGPRLTSSTLIVIIFSGLTVCVVVFYYWLLARIFYLLYPDTTRRVRRGALIRIFVVNIAIELLLQAQTIYYTVVSLFPPDWFY
jgi:hypothetical protein